MKTKLTKCLEGHNEFDQSEALNTSYVLPSILYNILIPDVLVLIALLLVLHTLHRMTPFVA